MNTEMSASKKLKEFTNYLLIGILTTTVSLITFFVFTKTIFITQTPKDVQMANFMSWFCSVVFAYFTSRDFVFNSKESNKVKEAIYFLSSRVITLLLEIILIEIMIYLFSSGQYMCKVASQALAIVMNYVLAKILVFK